jgi:hypothetical protein
MKYVAPNVDRHPATGLSGYRRTIDWSMSSIAGFMISIVNRR